MFHWISEILLLLITIILKAIIVMFIINNVYNEYQCWLAASLAKALGNERRKFCEFYFIPPLFSFPRLYICIAVDFFFYYFPHFCCFFFHDRFWAQTLYIFPKSDMLNNFCRYDSTVCSFPLLLYISPTRRFIYLIHMCVVCAHGDEFLDVIDVLPLGHFLRLLFCFLSFYRHVTQDCKRQRWFSGSLSVLNFSYPIHSLTDTPIPGALVAHFLPLYIHSWLWTNLLSRVPE